MKYVRTEDGIFKVAWQSSEDSWNVYSNEFESNSRIGTLQVQKSQMIAQSDDIEELCDEFVVEDRGHFGIISDIEAKEICVDKTIIIYGAIWTDKGLIYVAKMNSEGVMELL